MLWLIAYALIGAALYCVDRWMSYGYPRALRTLWPLMLAGMVVFWPVELWMDRSNCVRWRMWRNTANDLNRRVEVENALLAAAKDGYGLNAERCRELAYKLGVPKI